MKGGVGVGLGIVNQTLIVKDHNSLKNWHKSCSNFCATYISLTFLQKGTENQIMKKKNQIKMPSEIFFNSQVPNFT